MHDVGTMSDGRRLVALDDGEFDALFNIRGGLAAMEEEIGALLDGLPGLLMGTLGADGEPRAPLKQAAVNGGGTTKVPERAKGKPKPKPKPKQGGKAGAVKRQVKAGGVVTVRKVDVVELLREEPESVAVLYLRFLDRSGAVASSALFKNFGKCLCMLSADVAERVSRGVYRRPRGADGREPPAPAGDAPDVPPVINHAERLRLLKETDARLAARKRGE